MTESFIDNNAADQTAQNNQSNLSDTDTGQAGGEGFVDTKSPEYQLQILQKRLDDKEEFINTLKDENQTTREMYASLEERMKNMEDIKEVLNGQEQHVGSQDTGLDEDAVVGKVIENLNKKQTEEKMVSNYNSVLERLDSEFGRQNIEEKVQQAAQENGLTVDDMRETARKSPQAFYKLVGLEGKTQQKQYTQPTRGTQQPPQDTGEKDFAYYSRLMRENPREYWKPETQREFRKLFTHNKSN